MVRGPRLASVEKSKQTPRAKFSKPQPDRQQAVSHFVLISIPGPVSKTPPQPRNEQLGHGFYPPIRRGLQHYFSRINSPEVCVLRLRPGAIRVHWRNSRITHPLLFLWVFIGSASLSRSCESVNRLSVFQFEAGVEPLSVLAIDTF